MIHICEQGLSAAQDRGIQLEPYFIQHSEIDEGGSEIGAAPRDDVLAWLFFEVRNLFFYIVRDFGVFPVGFKIALCENDVLGFVGQLREFQLVSFTGGVFQH